MSLTTPVVMKNVMNKGTTCSMSVSLAFCDAAILKAAPQVAILESVPTTGEEQRGSVKVEDNGGERVTGFLSFSE